MLAGQPDVGLTAPVTSAVRPRQVTARLPWPLWGLPGALAGAAAEFADGSPWQWAADLGTFPAAWVLVVALMARPAPSAGVAAARGAVFFTGMTLAYYAWGVWVRGFDLGVQLPVWLVLSVTAVPIFAVTVWWSTRRRTAPGALAAGALLAVAGAVVLARGMAGRLWAAGTGGLPDGVAVHPPQVVVDVVVVLVVTGLLPRHRPVRVWALGLLLPMALALRLLLDGLGR